VLYASPSADSGSQANSRVEATLGGDEELDDPCDDDGCVPLSLPFPDSAFG